MQSTKCAICGLKVSYSTLFKANFYSREVGKKTFSARRLPDNLHYRIVRCKKCGLVRSSPIFSEKKIHSLYKKSEITYQSQIHYLRQTYGKYLNKIVCHLQKKTNFLEIGCGTGFFLKEGLAQGFKNVYGVEPGRKSVKQAQKKLQKFIINDFFHRELFSKKFFDIVCCFHTLDHVIDPNEFIRDAYQMLKPGGFAFFITHDVDSLGAVLFKEKWPIFDIEHIYLFNKNTLAKIFVKNKFRIVRIFNIKNKYSLDYWLKMCPLPTKLKSILISMVGKLRLSNLPVSFPIGNIGIFAVRS